MPEQHFITWNRQLDPPLMKVAGAESDEFVLEDGRRVYDFVSTSFQAGFGHSSASIRQRIHQQLDRMPMASPKSLFGLKDRVSRRLVEFLNQGDVPQSWKIFYTVSGSEAVENALKIARHMTGRPRVLSRMRSYHGATLGALSVGGDWRSEPHVQFTAGTVRIPEPDDDPQAELFRKIVEQTGAERIAAVIVETISGVNGVVIPPRSWWDGVTRTCRETGILLIVDEVLAGFGRTGPAFAFHHFGLEPDLVCMSKGITGGYVPFGAVAVASRIASRYDDQVLACGLTNYAHPLGLAALDAVLDQFADSGFRQAKQDLEGVFSAGLKQLDEMPGVVGHRSRGLLAAIDFESACPAWQTCVDAGLYVVTRDKMMILAPPFVSRPERLQQAFATVTGLIEELPVARH